MVAAIGQAKNMLTGQDKKYWDNYYTTGKQKIGDATNETLNWHGTAGRTDINALTANYYVLERRNRARNSIFSFNTVASTEVFSARAIMICGEGI